MRHLLTLLTIISFSSPALAEESLEMEGTRIRGNQELPKVLYIVPWKQGEIPVASHHWKASLTKPWPQLIEMYSNARFVTTIP